MGNDGQGQLILLKSDLIRFEFKKDGYFDCQLVEGSLILQANKEIKLDEIIIRLRMIQSFNIILSKDNVVTNYFQKKIFLQKLNLPYIFNQVLSIQEKIKRAKYVIYLLQKLFQEMINIQQRNIF